MALGPIGGSSKSPPCRVYCSEVKKDNRGQSYKKGQKVENSREEEEKTDRVPSSTSGQSTGREHHLFGGHGRFSSHGN